MHKKWVESLISMNIDGLSPFGSKKDKNRSSTNSFVVPNSKVFLKSCLIMGNKISKDSVLNTTQLPCFNSELLTYQLSTDLTLNPIQIDFL